MLKEKRKGKKKGKKKKERRKERKEEKKKEKKKRRKEEKKKRRKEEKKQTVNLGARLVISFNMVELLVSTSNISHKFVSHNECSCCACS